MSANQTATALPDASLVNTPIPEQTVFTECWSAVQQVLDYCLTHSPADIKTWFDANKYITTYTAVYKYCVAPRVTTQGEPPVYFHGEKLYKQLDTALTALFGKCGDALVSVANQHGEELVREYNTMWERVAVMARHVEAIFMYVERHWIDRQIQSKPTRSTPDIYRIKQLVYIKWQLGVINKVIDPIKAAIVARLSLERANSSLEFDHHIKLLIAAFQAISADITPMSSAKSEPSKVRTFPDTIEPLYLSCLEGHVKRVSATVGDLDHLRAVWDEEQARAAHYLPDKKSSEKVKTTIKDALFIPCIDMIVDGFGAALAEWNSVKCLEIYGLMEVQADLLNHLDTAFTRHCHEQLNHLPDSQPEVFVAAILGLHRSASDFIETSLKGRQSMFMARDQAFRQFLRNHRGGRVHDLLAISLDHALRDSSLTHDAFKHRVDDVIAVFKLLDDKDSFRVYYAKLLTLRLLTAVSFDCRREQLVIDELSLVCGGGYTGALQRMLADRLGSTDLTASCLGIAKSAVQNECTVITSGSWPVNPHPYPFLWPEPIAQEINTFTTKYMSTNKKRKLEWLPQLSRIEVGCGGGVLVMSVVQYAVLRHLFNGPNSFVNADAVARQSQIPVDIVAQELESAGKMGLLLVKTGANSRLGYQVNPGFEPKDTVYLSRSMDTPDQDVLMESGEGGRPVDVKTDEESKNITLAAIIKIAKREQELELSKLILAVQNQVHPWIPGCPAELVMACVEMAIDKEYVKRVAADIVQYLP